jgi:hypothetical protein
MMDRGPGSIVFESKIRKAEKSANKDNKNQKLDLFFVIFFLLEFRAIPAPIRNSYNRKNGK